MSKLDERLTGSFVTVAASLLWMYLLSGKKFVQIQNGWIALNV